MLTTSLSTYIDRRYLNIVSEVDSLKAVKNSIQLDWICGIILRIEVKIMVVYPHLHFLIMLPVPMPATENVTEEWLCRD